MPNKIRVLVVDDSAFMRIAVKRTLESEPLFEVIGQAKDGADAVQKVKELQPDVVTMDFNMPRMNGVQAIEAIFKDKPVPIVMISAHTQEGAKETMEALAAGAVDFVPKPDGEVSTDLSKVKGDIFRKLKAAARSRPRRPVAATPPKVERQARAPSPRVRPNSPLVVVAISTGGPAALERVIPRLPADFGAGLLIVQHMPAAFTKALAQRLDGISKMPVKEAAAGDMVGAGAVLIAPGDRHTIVDPGGTVQITTTPPVNGCRPSADVTLQSAARSWGSRLTAVVMTGMGKDGALGAAAVKASGGRVLAQDKESSVVYGMPKAVIERGLAEKVLPLEGIAPELVSRFP